MHLAQDAAQPRLGAVARAAAAASGRGAPARGAARPARPAPTRESAGPCRCARTESPASSSALDACGVRVAHHELHLLCSISASQRRSTSDISWIGPSEVCDFQAAQPARQEGERQRVRRRESAAWSSPLRRPRAPRREPAPRAPCSSCGRDPEPFAGCGQPGRLRAAVEQVGAQPLLQRPDAAAEGGLGHVALLGRARKVAAGRQRQEVVEPGSGSSHGAVLPAHRSREKRHWRSQPTSDDHSARHPHHHREQPP